MSAPDVPRPRRLAARLAALLSLRTISGKLIVGLVVLFGAASIITSVITAESLTNSLMSSLDQQLQSATMRWQACVTSPDGDADAHRGSGSAGPPGPSPACYGQATGTFEAKLAGHTFSSQTMVPGTCQLSAADERTLLALHSTPLPPGGKRFTRADTGRARDPGAAGRSTGLGLAIVDAVVAAHGGCIAVTSRPGRTRFAIILPLLREPADQPQASPV
jgi:hypothetical protein